MKLPNPSETRSTEFPIRAYTVVFTNRAGAWTFQALNSSGAPVNRLDRLKLAAHLMAAASELLERS